MRTTNGGATWNTAIVPDADSLDFRDVEAFSADVAFLMSAGPGGKSRIYKTTNAGHSWSVQLTNQYPTAFFDGMAFWDKNNGMVYSDPVDGKHLLYKTRDGGQNWLRIPPEKLHKLFKDEYGFAASGTGIRVFGTDDVWIATGGARARIFYSSNQGESWSAFDTPVLHGSQSRGIFSIAFRDRQNGVAVGGDFTKPAFAENGIARTTNGGKNWQLPVTSKKSGYRSCVAYVPETSPPLLLAVGSDGVSYSTDDGVTWADSDSTGYHTISFSNSRDSGWVAGAEGRVAKIIVSQQSK